MSASIAREQVQRLIFRCISESMISAAARLCRNFDGDFNASLVFMALCQGDGAPQGPGVSVRGLAGALEIPPETVRRKMHGLIESGRAARAPGGGYAVTVQAIRSDAESARREEDIAALNATLGKLAALGYQRATLQTSSLDETPDAISYVSRAFDAFLLRNVKSGSPVHGDPTNAVIFTALTHLNATPVAYDPVLAWTYAGRDTPPPAAMLRPATAAEVAERLAMAPLTVRRRLAVMAALERCDRTKSGYVARRAFLDGAAVMETGLLASQYFEQMLDGLNRRGHGGDR